MAATARVILTRPPRARRNAPLPERAPSPFFPHPGGRRPDCLQLRASDEHSILQGPEPIGPECATREHRREPGRLARLMFLVCALREQAGQPCRPPLRLLVCAPREHGGHPRCPWPQSHSSAPFFHAYQNPTSRMRMNSPISRSPSSPNLLRYTTAHGNRNTTSMSKITNNMAMM